MAYNQKYLYHGEMLNIRQMIEKSGNNIKYGAVKLRIDKGWPVQLAVETPQLMIRSSKKTPACGARSFYSCFACPFPDCVINHIICFDDDPTSDDPFFTDWRRLK